MELLSDAKQELSELKDKEIMLMNWLTNSTMELNEPAIQTAQDELTNTRSRMSLLDERIRNLEAATTVEVGVKGVEETTALVDAPSLKSPYES